MSTNVDYQTAKELRGAGFPQPFPMERCEYFEDKDGATFAPTALEIIEQMPLSTSIVKAEFGIWKVTFPLPSFQRDFRHDACPHIAAALAFIAWKRGQE